MSGGGGIVPPRTEHECYKALHDAVIRELGLDWDATRAAWWLPAEPGPVLCNTLEEALHRFVRLA